VVPRSVVVPPMNGPALVAMVLSSMLGPLLFGFFFSFDFGAELGVFFVFDGAARFFVFVFGFFSVFAFVACFGFFAFLRGRGGEVAGQGRDAQRLRRGGRGEQREQQEDEQEGEELAHRPFIGAATRPL
jgi:hypothetical protein